MEEQKRFNTVQTMTVQQFRERVGRRNLDWMEFHDTNLTWVCRGRKDYQPHLITKRQCKEIRESGQCEGCDKRDYGNHKGTYIHEQ